MTSSIVKVRSGDFSFLSSFPESMITPAFLPSQDPPGFGRKQFHEWLNAEAYIYIAVIKHLSGLTVTCYAVKRITTKGRFFRVRGGFVSTAYTVVLKQAP